MDLSAFVEKHGGQTEVAKLLGVSQGLVWQWLCGRTRVTAERAIEIEKKTGDQVTRHDLRPDIFGPAP